MTEKEFGNFSKWPLKELVEKERSFSAGDRRGAELRAELDRRLAAQHRRSIPINGAVKVLGALAAIVTIVIALDKGIYLGSVTTSDILTEPIGGDEKLVKLVTTTHKVCRYLFVTGIAELPALGGFGGASKGYAIDEDPPTTPLPWPSASSLHCRFFAE